MDQRTPRPPGLCGSRRTLRRRALRGRAVTKLRLAAGQGGYIDGARDALDEVCVHLEMSCELVKQRAQGMGLDSADVEKAMEETRAVIDVVERMIGEYERLQDGARPCPASAPGVALQQLISGKQRVVWSTTRSTPSHQDQPQAPEGAAVPALAAAPQWRLPEGFRHLTRSDAGKLRCASRICNRICNDAASA
mmetsp:Transcript_75820/g.236017  ORF Transcript_75820/g.236017 Transcript_75820/m.236017 type:complete len:193 (+) Transcript_75820:116-694(+)